MTGNSSTVCKIDENFDGVNAQESAPDTSITTHNEGSKESIGVALVKPRAVKLLIAHEENEQAGRVRNIFQQAGWPTHAHRITSIEDLEDSLANGEWNLIVAYGNSSQFKAALIGKYALKHKHSIRAIFLDDAFSATNALQITQCGFHDYLTIGESERLLFAAAREIDALENSQRLRAADNVLAEVSARSQLLMDSSNDAIAYVTDGMIVNVNQAFAAQLGFDTEDELDCYPFTDLVAEKDQGTIRPLLRRYQKGEGDESTVTIEVLRVDGTATRCELSIAVASYDGETCTQIILRTESQAGALAQGETHASDLGEIFSSTERGTMLYVALDTDAQSRQKIGLQKFTSLVDTVGTVIGASLPSAAVIQRYQQENWLIVVPESFKHEPQTLATDICSAVLNAGLASAENHHTEDNTGTSVSIGISRFGVADMTAEIALERAYAAAGEQQLAGGNGFKMFAPKIANASGAAALQTALMHDSFALRYQPVVGLQNNSIHHYEAVLYIDDGGGNVQSADELLTSLGIEEDNVALDRWRAATLCTSLSQLDTNEQKIRVLLPVTAAAVMHEDFTAELTSIAATNGIDPNTLILSFDAGDIANHTQSALSCFDKLRAENFDICLSGATTEHEKLLNNTQPAFTKLSGCLTEAMLDDESDPEQMRSLIRLAADNNILCIASNINSAAELAQLWQSGVPYVQGNYLQEAGDSMEYEFEELG